MKHAIGLTESARTPYLKHWNITFFKGGQISERGDIFPRKFGPGRTYFLGNLARGTDFWGGHISCDTGLTRARFVVCKQHFVTKLILKFCIEWWYFCSNWSMETGVIAIRPLGWNSTRNLQGRRERVMQFRNIISSATTGYCVYAALGLVSAINYATFLNIWFQKSLQVFLYTLYNPWVMGIMENSVICEKVTKHTYRFTLSIHLLCRRLWCNYLRSTASPCTHKFIVWVYDEHHATARNKR